MLLIFLDTETTGLNPEKHRAIEIAFKIFDTLSSKIISSYESIISQPQEIWANADQESIQFNQFTYEEVLKGKPEKVVESEITTYFNMASIVEKTGCFICQNPSFDRAFFNKIISIELQTRYRWPYHWLDLASMYLAFRYFSAKGKLDLKEHDLTKDSIATYFGLPLEKTPHRAMNGVNHLLACYQKIVTPFLEQTRDVAKQ